MDIRKASESDIPGIMEIYEYAREFMASTGNPNQWGPRKWPPERIIRRDIEQEKSYLCIGDDGHVAGVFFYDHGHDIDSTYRVVEGGAWRHDRDYGVVHRIASDGTPGVGTFCLTWALKKSGYIRIDTHDDNKVMQNLLTKLGFERVGIIYVEEDTAPRIAFERLWEG